MLAARCESSIEHLRSSIGLLSVNRADAEFDVADVGVWELIPQGLEDLLFLEGKFLDDDGVGDRDFEAAALEPAGQRVGSEITSSGYLQ